MTGASPKNKILLQLYIPMSSILESLNIYSVGAQHRLAPALCNTGRYLRKLRKQVKTMKLTPEDIRQHLIRVTLKPISFSPSYDKRIAKPVNPNIKQTLKQIFLGSNVKLFLRNGDNNVCSSPQNSWSFYLASHFNKDRQKELIPFLLLYIFNLF